MSKGDIKMAELKKGKLTATDLKHGRNGIILTPRVNLKATVVKSSEFNQPIEVRKSVERAKFERQVESIVRAYGLDNGYARALISMIDDSKQEI